MTTSQDDRSLSSQAPTRLGQGLVVVGIVSLALNLRPAAVSIGPVLEEVRAGLDMSSTEAGVLTSLPVVAFAAFGALAPRAAARVGPHRLTAIALLAISVGLVARSRVEGVGAFLALSLLSLAGMATANVVLPSLVKRHFPHHVATMTAIYSTALAVGLTSASVLTVPISRAAGGGDAADGWRTGLVAWAVLAVVALVPWLLLLGRDRAGAPGTGSTGTAITFGRVARTRLGWLMAGFFGFQALQAYAIFGWLPAIYRDAGFSPTSAGVLLGVVTGTSIPMSFLLPSLAGRMRDVSPILWALGACYAVGYGGLVLEPAGAAWLWAILIGAGTSTFPLVLVLIGLRSRTPQGTASLSGFTQAVGYLLSAVGPLGVGVLHDASGGWTVPVLTLLALVVPLLACALAVARPRYLEDELEHRSQT